MSPIGEARRHGMVCKRRTISAERLVNKARSNEGKGGRAAAQDVPKDTG